MKALVMVVAFAVAMAAKADYWMTFCKTPGGQQYAQVGYVKPDVDGWVRDDQSGTANGRRVQDAGVVSEDARRCTEDALRVASSLIMWLTTSSRFGRSSRPAQTER